MTNYEKIQPGKKDDKSNPVTLLVDKNRISLIPGGLTGTIVTAGSYNLHFVPGTGDHSLYSI